MLLSLLKLWSNRNRPGIGSSVLVQGMKAPNLAAIKIHFFVLLMARVTMAASPTIVEPVVSLNGQYAFPSFVQIPVGTAGIPEYSDHAPFVDTADPGGPAPTRAAGALCEYVQILTP